MKVELVLIITQPSNAFLQRVSGECACYAMILDGSLKMYLKQHV